jgi:hypothetical protein
VANQQHLVPFPVSDFRVLGRRCGTQNFADSRRINVPRTLSFQRRTLNYSGRGRVTGSHAYLDLTRGKALELLAINGDSRAISAHQPETCCSDAVSTRTLTKTTSAISSATKPSQRMDRRPGVSLDSSVLADLKQAAKFIFRAETIP